MNRLIHRAGVLVGAICALTLLIHAPALRNGFVEYDDPEYVTRNAMVRDGLTWPGVRWAFTKPLMGNRHPLTALSHMLDVTLYGLRPWGHHLTSVLLHAANAALLFLLLQRTTGAAARSAGVALLFAWHPIHVESVAWVAERKNVLCGFFFLLSTLSYARWAASRSRRDAAGSLAFFACALLSKAVAVVLPALLLVLDGWPLRRLDRSTSARCLAEKAPYLLLALAFGGLAVLVQHASGAMGVTPGPRFGLRLGNAVVSYVSYLDHALWPKGLSVFYPHPMDAIPAALIAYSLALLILITALAIRSARSRPCLLAGWCWYLVAMLPTAGLLQVGAKAMADRYAYLPLIGIFVMAVWGACEGARALSSGRSSVMAAAVLAPVCLALAAATVRQIGHWRSTTALFRQAYRSTSGNYVAAAGLGIEALRSNDTRQAVALLEEAVAINPAYAPAHHALGQIHLALGRRERALPHAREAVRINQRSAEFLEGLRRVEEASPLRVGPLIEPPPALPRKLIPHRE